MLVVAASHGLCTVMHSGLWDCSASIGTVLHLGYAKIELQVMVQEFDSTT
jgi:hypothetical protein